MEQETTTTDTIANESDLLILNFWAKQSQLMTKARRRQGTQTSAAFITEKLNTIYSDKPSRLSRYWQRLQFQYLPAPKW